ncbi:Ppx/GppA phosphatase family protein [Geobacter pickeringii]|uniref:Ppx/GppA phosphatase family protein n=1 Tax=Geobacter pickeringii TaxID=345632 RepID=UPI0038B275E7
MPQTFASIDLGTNTARLLIGRVDGEEIVPLGVKRQITRLGGGFTRERGISAEAWQRSRDALIGFAEEIRSAGVSRARAVATSAVRDAVNGPAFCADILEHTGIALEVIDGREEGLLTLRGVLSGLDRKHGDFCVFDVGGGSTEYTLADGATPLFTESLPLGVVRLTEGKPDISSMKEKIARELGGVKSRIAAEGYLDRLVGARLVGTAGTATTLAAISLKMDDYDYRRVNNYVLPIAEIRDILARLVPLSPPERLKVPGLEKGREDLIIAGTLITLATMEILGFEQMTVSDFGLLEGVLLGLLNS